MASIRTVSVKEALSLATLFAPAPPPFIIMMASQQHPHSQLVRSPSFVLSAREVSRSCEEATELMELVAELLLLRSGSKAKALYPVSRAGDSFSKSRDAIVANTKGLAISIKDITHQLKDDNFIEVERTVRSIADKVTVLIEASSQAAYTTALCVSGSTSATPGVIDQYYFAKARLIVSNTCSKLSSERGSLTNEDVLELTQTIANNLTVLRQNCQQAAEATGTISELSQNQFSACVQSLDGTSAAFVAAVKTFITSEQISDRKKVAMFAVPLAAAVNSVASFAGLPEFAGHLAQISAHGEQSQTEILASAMGIISASVQMLNTIILLIEHKVGLTRNGSTIDKKTSVSDERHWQRLVSCTRAVADSCKMLASSIREHTPHASPQVTQRANTRVV